MNSCQEPYFQEDLEADQKILVVDGLLTNADGPYEVKLEWASAYNSSRAFPVKNAKVTIQDNDGNFALLHEEQEGVYSTTDIDFRGKPGFTYQLRIELNNGEIYESVPALLQKCGTMDSLFARPAKREVFSENSYGDVVVKEELGLNVYLNADTLSNDNIYYHFVPTVVIETLYYLLVPNHLPPSTYVRFCWSIAPGKLLPTVKVALPEGNHQIIKEENISFLSYTRDSRLNASPGSAPLHGWVVHVQALRINADTYRYYKEIVKQLGAEQRLFDPIPSQIKGNIRCITDTTKLALGYFEVAGVSNITSAFAYNPYTNKFKTNKLMYYTPPEYSGCQDTIKPDFWVYIR